MSYLSISELCKSLLWAPVDHERGERADVYCATDTSLDLAEAQLGAKLPEDYRWFMKHYGMRGLDDARVNPGLKGISLSFLGMFYAIETAVALSQRYSRPDLQGASVIPPWSLVIADSIAGDLLLLELSSQAYGQVSFRPSAMPRQNWAKGTHQLTPMADSFTHLLAQIVANPQYETSPTPSLEL